jgi:hypothetical protein
MKVISVDNYDRDDDCQLLIAGPGLTPAEAKRIADEHNDQTEGYSPRFYRVVPDEQPLYVWEP